MYKKSSWIVALLLALSFSAFFIGCVEPLAPPAEDKGAYTEFELGDFNLFGGNAENQAGWATDGSWDSKGKKTKDIGLTVEMLQGARYLVVELNDGFPKNNFETIYDSFDATGKKIGDWQQFSGITNATGALNPGMGEKNGNTFKLPMEKIIKNYPTFMDPDTAAISFYIQHWGNGGTGACIKSAKLLISDEPPPFDSVTDIDFPNDGAVFGFKEELKLTAAVVPSFASKNKILWSIIKWVSEDEEITYDLEAAKTGLEIYTAKTGIKSKVDFTVKYNENDEAIQGRDAIIATDGIESGGTVTLKATIKDAVYDKATDKYSDYSTKFTVTISNIIPYEVPASGPGFFYVDLNDWKTQTPESANINAVVPKGKTTENDITINFAQNNQRVNFKFSDAQAGLVFGADTSIVVDIQGTATGTGDAFRYHIGNALVGADWNATGSPTQGTFDSITGPQTLTFGGNKDKEGRCNYLILQHRSGDPADVVITSIKITYGSTDALSPILVGFGPSSTVVTPGNNGSVTYAGGGFTFEYGTAPDSNYGNAITRFKVDLGSAHLTDYNVKFTWTGVSGDIISYKRIYLLASATEAAITPWKGDADIKALVVNSTNVGSFYDGDGPQMNGTDPTPVEMEVKVHGDLTGEVWFAIYAGATDGKYTITNLVFQPK